jgi:hypothetical protein
MSVDSSPSFSVFVTAATATTTVTQFYPNPSSSAAIWANVIQLRYKSSDVAKSTAASTAPATSIAAQTSSPATSTPSTSPISKKSGLSTGAKIAIGVVIPVVVLSALVLIGFILYRRKSSGRQKGVQPSELPAERPVVEMAVAPTPKESGRRMVAELEANPHYR